MQVATIDNAACDRASGCPVVRFCVSNAVKPAPGGAYPGANGWQVDEEACTGCGVCVRVCPTRSVSMHERVGAVG